MYPTLSGILLGHCFDMIVEDSTHHVFNSMNLTSVLISNQVKVVNNYHITKCLKTFPNYMYYIIILSYKVIYKVRIIYNKKWSTRFNWWVWDEKMLANSGQSARVCISVQLNLSLFNKFHCFACWEPSSEHKRKPCLHGAHVNSIYLYKHNNICTLSMFTYMFK